MHIKPLSGSKKRMLGMLAGAAIMLSTFVYLKQWHPTSQGNANTTTPTTAQTPPNGPPWVYGRTNARFTIVGYADLTCPYCRDYFPVLRQWIDEHADVNWQWHHLPLSSREPKASHAARLTECAGKVGGNDAFWNAVAWIYEHDDDSDLSALIRHANIETARAAFLLCVDANHLDAIIQIQAAAALSEGIRGTPTLRAKDRTTGRTITLSGPEDENALLSAIDFLVSSHGEESPVTE